MAAYKGSVVDVDFLKKFLANTEILIKKLENEEERRSFFSQFPFQEFGNVVIMDEESFRLTVKILNFCKQYSEFYTCLVPLEHTMDFILTNLSIIIEDSSQIICLLQLLTNIIEKRVGTNLMAYFKKYTERIGNVLLHSLKSIFFMGKQHYLYYGKIVDFLIQSNDCVACVSDDVICEMFLLLKNHSAISDICIICKSVLQRSTHLLWGSFETIYLWLLKESSYLLAVFLRQNDKNLIEDILVSMVYFLQKYRSTQPVATFDDCLNEFSDTLLNISDTICLLFDDNLFTKQALTILEFALERFCTLEGFPSFLFNKSKFSLGELPRPLVDWPKHNNDVLFIIYHMVIKKTNNIKLWKKRDILITISRNFYMDRHLMNIMALKSIYYLYPILIKDIQLDLNTKILGCDLLAYFANLLNLPYMYSYTKEQLEWLLLSTNHAVKRAVVLNYLNAKIETKMLANALKKSKSEHVLIEILLEDESGNNCGKICATLLQNMISTTVSNDIALLIPFVIEKPKILHNLLLAGPGIPDNLTNSVLLSTIMCPIILMIEEEPVLRAACVFSSKLLSKFNKTSLCLSEFCKNIKNLQQMIKLIDDVEEYTSIEIIRLFKVIIVVQKLNNFKFEESIAVDFSRIFLKGSTFKNKKSLSLLRQIISSKKALITIDENDLFQVYRTLLTLTIYSDLEILAYDCVAILICQNPWLATHSITVIHIEMTSLSTVNEGSAHSFQKMLFVWLQTLQKHPLNGFCTIPEFAIRSFLNRGFAHSKMLPKYLEILNNLLKRSQV